MTTVLTIRAKDGIQEIPYSECQNIFSPTIGEVETNTCNMIHVELPEATLKSFRHLLNMLKDNYFVTSDIVDLREVKDTVKMLGLNSLIPDIDVEKYEWQNVETRKELYKMTIRNLKISSQEQDDNHKLKTSKDLNQMIKESVSTVR